jgi:phage gp29-like protein
MPLRVGKYRPGETEDNIAILKSAVANLGSDAAAVIPEGMLIEFIETANAQGGDVLFIKVADWFDKQLSKGILGQTMTADDGSSQAQAKVHDEVREDIRDADAEQLAETLERDLVIPYIDLNHGPQENYPSVYLREPDQTDIPVMAEALNLLVPLGLEVEASEVRDRLGFSDPAKGAICLRAAASPAPIIPGKQPIAPAVATNHEQGCPHCTALNSEAAQPDAADLLATRLSSEADPATSAMIDKIHELIMAGSSLVEIRDQLFSLFEKMDSAALGAVMTKAFTTANFAGRAEVANGD